MHSLCSTGAARGATLVFGIGLAAVSGISAFRNGNTLGADEIDKIVFGSGFVFVVGLTWFLPTLAEDRFRSRNFLGAGFISLIWAACMIFAVWNAVGFTALHRTGAVAGREVQADRYSQALALMNTTRSEIELAKTSKLYERTAACTNDTAPQSMTFCQQLRGKEQVFADARKIVDAGKPGSADPQSETVSWLTGYNPSDLGKAFPVAFGILVELGAIVAFYAGLGGRNEYPAPIPTIELTVDPEPSSRLSAPVKRETVKLARKRETPALPAPGIRLRADGQLDGRCAMARRAKKMKAFA